ncbi:MarR family transcriptional regulator [soil metagenome]
MPSARQTRPGASLASALAVSVGRLARRLRQERDSELTATQLSALGTLRVHGPLAPGALAAYEKVQPPSMTRTVNCLAESGLVRREPHHTDGRQVVLHLSDEGAVLLAAERRRRDAWLAQRLRGLTIEERDLLRRAAPLLEKLARS